MFKVEFVGNRELVSSPLSLWADKCIPKHNFYLVRLLVNTRESHPLKGNTLNVKLKKYCKNRWAYISTSLRNFQNHNIEMSEWLIQQITALWGTSLMLKISVNTLLQQFVLGMQFHRAIFAKPEKRFHFLFGCCIVISIRKDVDEELLLFRNNQVSI